MANNVLPPRNPFLDEEEEQIKEASEKPAEQQKQAIEDSEKQLSDNSIFPIPAVDTLTKPAEEPTQDIESHKEQSRQEFPSKDEKKGFFGIFRKKREEEPEGPQSPASREHLEDVTPLDTDTDDFSRFLDKINNEDKPGSPGEILNWTDEKAVSGHHLKRDEGLADDAIVMIGNAADAKKKEKKDEDLQAKLKKPITPPPVPAVQKIVQQNTKIQPKAKKNISEKPEKPEKPEKIDKDVEQLFISVHKKHDRLGAEVKSIATGSNRKHYELKKAESIKELFELIKYMDEKDFRKYITSNKTGWLRQVKKFLKDIDKNERIRERILKKELLSLVEEHRKIIYHEIIDQKKSVSDSKKENERLYRELTKEKRDYDKRLSELDLREKQLVEKELRFDEALEEAIQKNLDSRLKKEKKDIEQLEKALKDIKDKYAKKMDELKDEEKRLQLAKHEAHDLLSKAESVRKKSTVLERKEQMLEQHVDALEEKYTETKSVVANIEQRDRLLKEQDRLLKDELEHLKKEREMLEKQDMDLSMKDSRLRSEIARLERKEAELKSRNIKLKEEEAKLKDFATKAKEAEKALLDDIATRAKVKHYIDRIGSKIKEDKKELEKETFSGYIKESLTHIGEYDHDTEDAVDVIDISKKSKHADLYTLIDACHDSIKNNDFENAKQLYQEVRRKYKSIRLEPQEKQVLYNLIRELYADIRLAMI